MRIVRNLLPVWVLLVATPAFAGDNHGKPAPTTPVKASASGSASAAPAPAPAASAAGSAGSLAEEVDSAARQLFIDGVAAFDRQEYAKAYALLLAAWKVKSHWQIAASLGATELQVGKPVDAASHLALYARESPPDRKEKAKKLLAEAMAKVGTLVVTVDPPDAEIFIDGVATGTKSGEGVYVEPDKRHQVVARKGADSAEVEIAAVAGKTNEVGLVIVRGTARSKVPTLVMGGVGVASLIAGAVLLGVAESNGADLRANAPRDKDGALLCWKTPAAGSATKAECDAWRSKASESSALGNASIGLFVLAGAAAAGAAAWSLWPSTPPAAARTWRVVPVVGSDGGGALITGKF